MLSVPQLQLAGRQDLVQVRHCKANAVAMHVTFVQPGCGCSCLLLLLLMLCNEGGTD
jgi:hypothetical protein